MSKEDYTTILDPIADLLTERNEQYGNANVRASEMLRGCDFANSTLLNHYPELVHDYVLAISKLARGANNPTHTDNWIDLIGYTVKILEYLRTKEY
jgi:hypothetical protein